MWPLVALAVMAAPAPRALSSSGVAVYAPRLDKLSPLTAWMNRAGTHAVVLRPESWRSEFHAFLTIDPTSAESLSQAGIDPAGAATISYAGHVRLTCHGLKDAKAYSEKALARLGTSGDAWSSKADGATLHGAKVLDRMVAGFALKGSESCAVHSQGPSAEKALMEAVKLLARPTSGGLWKSAASLPGAAFVVTPYGVAGLDAIGDSLTANGRTARLPVPRLAGAGPSPYAAMKPSGLVFARARIDPAQTAPLVRTLQAQMLDVCPACERGELNAVADALVPLLTGQVVFRADSVKVRESLRSSSGRYFAVKHAYVAEVTDAGKANALLDRIGKWKLARPSGSGFALTVKGGVVLIGLKGKHLYVGNDAAAVQALLDSIPATPGKMAHGAEASVDPALLAKGLSQVSLFDVMQSNELAGIFAAATEIGPLLAHSASIAGWADSAGEGVHAYRMVWTLKP